MKPECTLGPRFAEALEGLAGLPVLKGRAVVAAVSGGADSICLLGLLQGAAPVFGYRLRACHVNHGLRGAASDDDENLVRRYCAKLDLPLAVYHPRPARGGGEAAWREVRYACLANHMDDQAETVLFNLLRGSGLRGARGMRPLASGPAGLKLARPLLGFRGSELRWQLRAWKWAWREDASNQNAAFSRNMLRTRLFPLLERSHPGAVRNLAAFGRRAGEAAAWMEDFSKAGEALAALPGRPGCYSLKTLNCLDPFTLKLSLGCMASRLRGLERGLDAAALERLAGLANKGRGQCDLLKGWRGLAGRGTLSFFKSA